MKELSIEEKTKRYDEALERAKKLQETCDSTVVVGWCEYIFPELKESNGERIKFLIKSCVYASNITPEGREEIFAWFEKQGHMLDPDKVIEWLCINYSLFEGDIVEQFKKDFGL